jgi:hypothetical protein
MTRYEQVKVALLTMLALVTALPLVDLIAGGWLTVVVVVMVAVAGLAGWVFGRFASSKTRSTYLVVSPHPVDQLTDDQLDRVVRGHTEVRQ